MILKIIKINNYKPCSPSKLYLAKPVHIGTSKPETVSFGIYLWMLGEHNCLMLGLISCVSNLRDRVNPRKIVTSLTLYRITQALYYCLLLT